MNPQERVDKLIAAVHKELGATPTSVIVAADDWDWFAEIAIRTEGSHPKIKFEESKLMYNGLRIRRHR